MSATSRTTVDLSQAEYSPDGVLSFPATVLRGYWDEGTAGILTTAPRPVPPDRSWRAANTNFLLDDLLMGRCPREEITNLLRV